MAGPDRPQGRISLLGSPDTTLPDGRPGPAVGRQTWRVLAYLTVNRGRAVPRDELADALWSEALPASWEPALRGVIKKVRDVLAAIGVEGDPVTRTAHGYRLDPPPGLRIDMIEFQTAVEAARAALDSGRRDEVLELLAGGLPRGELLPGQDGEWIDAERSRLHGLVREALECECVAARLAGLSARSVRCAEALVAGDPIDDGGYRLLMEAHEAAGDRGAALRVYESCRRALAEQLGAEPSALTQEVHLRILRAQGPEEAASRPPVPGGLQARATVFAGRGGELQVLTATLRRVRDDGLHVVVVHGDPGIGKTRLIAEFAARAYADGATVMYGRCPEEAVGPFQPFAEALGPAWSRADASGEVLIAPGQGEVAIEDSLLSSDPSTLRIAFFDSVAERISRAIAASAGLVLVLDDLHWSDRPTLGLLEHVVRTKTGAPILVVLSYRSGEQTSELQRSLTELRRFAQVADLHLEGLDDEAMAALVGGWDDPVPKSLADALHERTGGNPFFALEMLRHLREGREALQVDHLDGVGVPQTVRDVIAGRIARLPRPASDVLLWAAVIGADFDLALLERLTDPDLDVPLILEDAIGAQVAVEDPGVVGSYRFAHHLIRQVVYEQATATRRARLHQRVGEALEALTADGPQDRVNELALHFAAAAPLAGPDRAVRYAEAAGRAALDHLAFEDATTYFKRAIEFTDRSDDASKARLLIALADAHSRAGEFTDSLARLVESYPHAERADCVDDIAVVLVRATSFLATNFDPSETDMTDRALEQTGHADSILRSVLLSRKALTTQAFGAPDGAAAEGLRLSAEAYDMARRLGDPTALAAALQALALCNAAPCPLPERIGLLDELVSLSEQTGNDPLRMNAYMWRAMEMLSRGDRTGAETDMEWFVRLGERTGHPWAAWRRGVQSASMATMDGDFELAESIVNETLQAGLAAGIDQALLYYAGSIFVLRLHQGRMAESADMLSGMNAAAGGGLFVLEAIMFCEIGRTAEAAAALERVAERGFAAAPRSFPAYWLDHAFSAWLTDELGAVEHAAELYDLLLPYQGRHLVWAGFGAYWGPADLLLGAMAALRGDAETAERLLRNAVAMCEQVAAPTWQARAQLRLARVLLRRDAARARGLLDAAAKTAERLGLARISRQIAELG